MEHLSPMIADTDYRLTDVDMFSSVTSKRLRDGCVLLMISSVLLPNLKSSYMLFLYLASISVYVWLGHSDLFHIVLCTF